MDFSQMALSLFLLSNPIGNTPAIVSLLKGIPFERQRKIMFREAMIALSIGIFFLYFGKAFLSLIVVKQYTLSMCSGLLLFLVAFEMIFPRAQAEGSAALVREPFIVPIATPLIAGPSFMTIVMLQASQEYHLKVLAAICTAWIFVTAILCSAPYVQRYIGKRGLVVLEQIMGMLLAMMAIETFISGLRMYVEQLAR